MQFLVIEGNIGAGKTTLAKKIADDFNANLLSGYVWWTDNNTRKDQQLTIKNKNNYAYTVFYQITAQHCTDSSKFIYLDPEIRNTGGGHN